jgi:CDP-glucose 4,6-dehydratase
MRLAEALAADPALAGEAFNFSNETPISVLGLVELLQSAAGSSVEPNVLGTAKNEISHQSLSAAKARHILGWVPTYSLEEALAETVAWYKRELGVAS